MAYPKPITRTLLSEEQLAARIDALAADIARDYAGKDLLLVAVLKGSVVFLADLMRALSRYEMPVHIDFMVVSSYGTDTVSSGTVQIKLDLKVDIRDRNLLLVEDIIDSGLTLNYLRRLLATRAPASVEVCALLNKPARNKIDIAARYVGFDIPDEFVVGYGLDYAEDYRELPFVGIAEA